MVVRCDLHKANSLSQLVIAKSEILQPISDKCDGLPLFIFCFLASVATDGDIVVLNDAGRLTC